MMIIYFDRFSISIYHLFIQEINDNLTCDEQILEAAKSIMNTSSALITAATLAQRELVTQGKVSLKVC